VLQNLKQVTALLIIHYKIILDTYGFSVKLRTILPAVCFQHSIFWCWTHAYIYSKIAWM